MKKTFKIRTHEKSSSHISLHASGQDNTRILWCVSATAEGPARRAVASIVLYTIVDTHAQCDKLAKAVGQTF